MSAALLVLNIGSSTIKFALYTADGDGVIARGRIENVGHEPALVMNEGWRCARRSRAPTGHTADPRPDHLAAGDAFRALRGPQDQWHRPSRRAWRTGFSPRP